MRIALDWSHKEEKLAVFDGEKVRKTMPKLTKGDQVFAENIPQKYAQSWLDTGVEIYRCTPNDSAALREALGLPKTDELDAQIIWRLAEERPDLFRRWEGDPILTTMYRTFKEIQKSRVRQGNRVWAKEEGIAQDVLTDLGAIEKKVRKAMRAELDKYPIWAWLQQIKGIDVNTAAGLVAFIDKLGIKNINTVSSLWHYFGVHVENGKAVRRAHGEAMTYNPEAKSLVLGVIADSFIKQRTPLYRPLYDTEKEKQLAKTYPTHELASKWHGYTVTDTHLSQGHANNRAKRKTMKIFLSHLWVIWRQLEGLETRPPFVHEQLKHEGYIKPPFIPKELQPFKAF